MKIKILEKSDSKIKFIVSGVKVSFAGALRRIMMSEIPTMAIEWVDFRKNDSVMPDEVLANRLGQIPLSYDRKGYNLPKECKCKGEGCSRCQVKMTIKKKGPGLVYSEDIKSSDKSVKPVIDKIPIVELFKDQELQLVATAQLGLGRDHTKWKGAAVGYKNVPKIKINKIDKKDLEKFVNVCPRGVFKISGDKLVVTDPLKCNLSMQCVDASKNNEIEVSPSEDEFVFNVESVSGLKVEDIVLLAAEILGSKMKEFQKAVKKVK
jgi:DNA-directed RNA polymerase subunit D